MDGERTGRKLLEGKPVRSGNGGKETQRVVGWRRNGLEEYGCEEMQNSSFDQKRMDSRFFSRLPPFRLSRFVRHYVYK